MWFKLAVLALVAQVCVSSPTVKETLDLGAGLINVAGTAASGLLHVAADTAQALSEKSDRVVHTLKRVTFGTNDRILDLLDTKIEFILCNIFQVCNIARPSSSSSSSFGRSTLGDLVGAEQLREINEAVLAEATDEIVEDARLFFAYEDNRDYLVRRIKALLCIYKDDSFCEEEGEQGQGRQLEVEEEKKPTLTKSLVVRKLFSHLTVKLGFIMCQLRVWCPDEELAFQ